MIEWAAARETRAYVMTTQDLRDDVDDEDEIKDGQIGLFVGANGEGAIVVGSPEELRVYLSKALALVNPLVPLDEQLARQLPAVDALRALKSSLARAD